MSDKTEGQFSGHQAFVLRILQISSSCISILAGILVIIWWFAPHRPDRKFRHELTMTLIAFDLLKAIIMIIYPARYLNADLDYTTAIRFPFCDGMGFMTAYAIQAADFAILLLAIHTSLLVFCSSGSKIRTFIPDHRLLIYLACYLLIPAAIAALGMIGSSGYTQFTTWCYLVEKPIWYRLVLSWIPRLLILLIIVVIYFAIYIRVKSELSELGSIVDFMRAQDRHYKHRWLMNLRIFISQFPGLGFLDPLRYKSSNTSTISIEDYNQNTLVEETPETYLDQATERNSALEEAGLSLGPSRHSQSSLGTFGTSGTKPPRSISSLRSSRYLERKTSQARTLESVSDVELTDIADRPQRITSSNHLADASPINNNITSPQSDVSQISSSIPTSLPVVTLTPSPAEPLSFTGRASVNTATHSHTKSVSISSPLSVQSPTNTSFPLRSQPNDVHSDLVKSASEIREDLTRENYERFTKKRSEIERQVNTIFIYPVAYLFLWLFPLIQQLLHYTHDVHHPPIFWIATVATWMKSFNCFVDSFVFVFREGHWRKSHRLEKRLSKEAANESMNDTTIHLDPQPDSNYHSHHGSEFRPKFFNYSLRFKRHSSSSILTTPTTVKSHRKESGVSPLDISNTANGTLGNQTETLRDLPEESSVNSSERSMDLIAFLGK